MSNNLNTEEQNIIQGCDMVLCELSVKDTDKMLVLYKDKYPYYPTILNRNMEFQKTAVSLFKKYKYRRVYYGSAPWKSINFLEVTTDNKTFVYMEFDECLNMVLNETRGSITEIPNGFKGNFESTYPQSFTM